MYAQGFFSCKWIKTGITQQSTGKDPSPCRWVVHPVVYWSLDLGSLPFGPSFDEQVPTIREAKLLTSNDTYIP